MFPCQVFTTSTAVSPNEPETPAVFLKVYGTTVVITFERIPIGDVTVKYITVVACTGNCSLHNNYSDHNYSDVAQSDHDYSVLDESDHNDSDLAESDHNYSDLAKSDHNHSDLAESDHN